MVRAWKVSLYLCPSTLSPQPRRPADSQRPPDAGAEGRLCQAPAAGPFPRGCAHMAPQLPSCRPAAAAPLAAELLPAAHSPAGGMRAPGTRAGCSAQPVCPHPQQAGIPALHPASWEPCTLGPAHSRRGSLCPRAGNLTLPNPAPLILHPRSCTPLAGTPVCPSLALHAEATALAGSPRSAQEARAKSHLLPAQIWGLGDGWQLLRLGLVQGRHVAGSLANRSHAAGPEPGHR